MPYGADENNGIQDASNSGTMLEGSEFNQTGNFGNDQSADGSDNSFNLDKSVDVDASADGSDNSKNWSNQQSFALDKSIDATFEDNDDNSDTNSHNYSNDESTDVDVAVEDAFNDKSTTTQTQDNDTDVDVAVEDAFNNKSTNDSNNDNSDRSDHNSHNDNSESIDVSLQDALNDKSIDDSYNSVSNETTTDVDVAITDAFKSHSESYSDAFNDSSESFGEISVNFENVFNGAFGAGAGDGFAVNQVADIVDNDALQDVTQNNGGNFNMQAGGNGANQWDAVIDPFSGGADGDGTTVADAGIQLQGTAFNLDIVLGSNLQQNAVDISIVGGSTDNDTITTSGDSF
ncbi:hypothetical protein [Pelagibacterium sp. H642]|uniref:hypothetical protein n=1 Tax=Pelagibacterium sp. H642 TaxID=1881069 RepID=UPI002814E621|nr:hypothetical protein [Pelagibacterium sp. H642]WMT89080.1 hypothetical protein NO934_09595 [Pelagibacterium sp. H642]